MDDRGVSSNCVVKGDTFRLLSRRSTVCVFARGFPLPTLGGTYAHMRKRLNTHGHHTFSLVENHVGAFLSESKLQIFAFFMTHLNAKQTKKSGTCMVSP